MRCSTSSPGREVCAGVLGGVGVLGKKRGCALLLGRPTLVLCLVNNILLPLVYCGISIIPFKSLQTVRVKGHFSNH